MKTNFNKGRPIVINSLINTPSQQLNKIIVHFKLHFLCKFKVFLECEYITIFLKGRFKKRTNAVVFLMVSTVLSFSKRHLHTLVTV